MNIPEIPLLSQFHYELPEERIAKFPLNERDASKLLLYEEGSIHHCHFTQLPDLLPTNTLLVFNDTKVIPARLILRRESGAKIEIFLLKPHSPTTEIQQMMASREPVIWETMIGNLKKWKSGESLMGTVSINGENLHIEANLVDKEKRLVKFSWSNYQLPFVSIVEASGEVPLPPYLNRKPTDLDRPRYQTVYSNASGAVAAPTAGLHFSERMLQKIEHKGIKTEYLTLHVSAGTFQPIKVEDVTQHPMHSEQISVSRRTLAQLVKHTGNVVAVGTTSMRTLESLYWYGVKLLEDAGSVFHIEKLAPYHYSQELPNKQKSFQAVLNHMVTNELETINGSTEIFIMPGYTFHVCNGMITNFHQPGSTLILLVAAYTRNDWRKLYYAALENGYRFLSYGDSNLIWHQKIE
ncbi:S-adenosylmethionine:tRNA ribosyltransferase-isomerase [Pararhodonellum marinum]|uniref:S-adenosylmethionine:tRNA ribosyltransferase-isomerase n=1 Tax=Pararhodonellum marinum TaxID=2755358 RepID=UPI00188F51EF|nr:S-adenosylmethionine:tRNA ribosyltransferase-isomerase [Pararhodonellum marinum]